jgi:2-phosphoglycolate phosphatase
LRYGPDGPHGPKGFLPCPRMEKHHIRPMALIGPITQNLTSALSHSRTRALFITILCMKTALFDLDGTLTDTRDDLTLAVNLTRADYNLPPVDRDFVISLVGNGVKPLIEGAFAPLPESYEQILKRYKDHYAAHFLVNTKLYPEVEKTLKAMQSAGWKLGVVTNKPSIFAAPILEGLNAAHFFEAIVGGGDTENLKPHPEPLYLAAEKMGVVLDSRDWMIGDHITDLESGKNAGVQTCFCEFGMGETRGALYDVAIQQMDELLAHL